MNNAQLIGFLESEIRRLRALGSPAARFAAAQLERSAVLLKFTGAHSEEEFDDRVECNEESAKAAAFERGWAEGRAQASREIAHGVHPHN